MRATKFPSAGGKISRLAYARLRLAGIDATPLLRKSGLTRYEIETEATPFRAAAQIEFLNQAAAALNDDHLGFDLGLVPDLREFGLLYYVLASSDSFAKALQHVERFSSIVNEGIALKFVDGQFVGISFRYVGISRHKDRHQIEFWMAALLRICRHLTGLRLFPAHATFTHRREHQSKKLVGFFGHHLRFGARSDTILFSRKIKDAALVGADPYLNKLLVSWCEQAIARQRRDHHTFRSTVENLIAPLLPHGEASAGEIARRLGLSARTFARRLREEGCTYTELLGELRQSLASRYLADEQLSISKIAWLLGYREVGAFSHAYKRWAGEPPRAARSRS